MFFSKLATTAALLATAIAGPLAATSGDETAQLTKRADGIHLVNCVTYSAVIVRKAFNPLHLFSKFAISFSSTYSRVS
jgi:hypothetical protein